MITFLVLINYSTVLAQGSKKKGGGSTPPSSSAAASTPSSSSGASSPAANTGSQQNGYVYRLPKNYHLFYYSYKDTMILIARDPKIPGSKILSEIFVKRRTIDCSPLPIPLTGKAEDQIRQIQLRDPCTLRPASPKLAAQLQPEEFKQEGIPDTLCIASICTNTDSLFKRENRIVDSLSRYFPNPRWNFLNLWKGRRMRVSITQADSGKLQIGIYDNNFLSRDVANDWRNITFTKIGTKDRLKPDYAIPISKGDSAQNFYLQVNNKIFAKDPLSYMVLHYSLTLVGAMTIPFKYRWPPHGVNIYNKNPQTQGDSIIAAPSESTGSINIALFLGRKWGGTKFYFDPSKTKNTIAVMTSVFAGPTLINLSNANVAYPKSVDSLPSAALAFSFGGALSIEWKGIDLGLFGGADFTSKSYHWIYNRRFWLGFGIGVNLSMFTSGPTQFQM